MVTVILPAFVLGLSADALCFAIAGAGHGTYVPVALSFGPLAVVRDNFAPAFILGPFLYCGYAIFIGRALGRGTATLRAVAVAAMHYGSAVLSVVQSGETTRSWLRVVENAPVMCLLFALVFIAVNAGGVGVTLAAITEKGRTK